MTFTTGPTLQEGFLGWLPFWGNGNSDQRLIDDRIKTGERDENKITNDVFFARHPELPRIPLRKDQTTLVREWLEIRDQLVLPALAKADRPGGTTPAPSGGIIYDGKTPAPGTVEKRQWLPCNPPLRGDPSKRSAALYDNVINQFAVGVNPRYAHKDGSTYCNIFAWDLTSAMGAETPHWVSKGGDPVPPYKGSELNANAMNSWLNNHGGRFGWQKTSLSEAVDAANRGCPVVASWNNGGGIGHIAVIRPGAASASEGPWMAQAGARNSNFIRMYSVWKKSANVEPWVHA